MTRETSAPENNKDVIVRQSIGGSHDLCIKAVTDKDATKLLACDLMKLGVDEGKVKQVMMKAAQDKTRDRTVACMTLAETNEEKKTCKIQAAEKLTALGAPEYDTQSAAADMVTEEGHEKCGATATQCPSGFSANPDASATPCAAPTCIRATADKAACCIANEQEPTDGTKTDKETIAGTMSVVCQAIAKAGYRSKEEAANMYEVDCRETLLNKELETVGKDTRATLQGMSNAELIEMDAMHPPDHEQEDPFAVFVGHRYLLRCVPVLPAANGATGKNDTTSIDAENVVHIHYVDHTKDEHQMGTGLLVGELTTHSSVLFDGARVRAPGVAERKLLGASTEATGVDEENFWCDIRETIVLVLFAITAVAAIVTGGAASITHWCWVRHIRKYRVLRQGPRGAVAGCAGPGTLSGAGGGKRWPYWKVLVVLLLFMPLTTTTAQAGHATFMTSSTLDQTGHAAVYCTAYELAVVRDQRDAAFHAAIIDVCGGSGGVYDEDVATEAAQEAAAEVDVPAHQIRLALELVCRNIASLDPAAQAALINICGGVAGGAGDSSSGGSAGPATGEIPVPPLQLPISPAAVGSPAPPTFFPSLLFHNNTTTRLGPTAEHTSGHTRKHTVSLQDRTRVAVTKNDQSTTSNSDGVSAVGGKATRSSDTTTTYLRVHEDERRLEDDAAELRRRALVVYGYVAQPTMLRKLTTGGATHSVSTMQGFQDALATAGTDWIVIHVTANIAWIGGCPGSTSDCSVITIGGSMKIKIVGLMPGGGRPILDAQGSSGALRRHIYINNGGTLWVENIEFKTGLVVRHGSYLQWSVPCN